MENTKDSYYLHLDSISFSKNYYINNQHFDFTSEILDPIIVNSDNYEVAITEIAWIDFKDEILSKTFLDFIITDPVPLPAYEMYVLCDIIKPEVQVGARLLPMLRIVKEPTIFQHLYYIPLSRGFINTIRIYVRKPDNSVPDLKIGGLRCTLHIKKKESP